MFNSPHKTENSDYWVSDARKTMPPTAQLTGLPSAEEIQKTAQRFLVQGAELAEAELLARCKLELGEVRFVRGSVRELDITMRCSREEVEQLKPSLDANGWSVEHPVKVKLREAV